MKPYSESKGHEYVDGKWLLSHVIWHPTLSFANALGDAPETGIRYLQELDEKGNPRFDLIQHGWNDFNKAGLFIKAALRKGWSVVKISDVMHWLYNR